MTEQCRAVMEECDFRPEEATLMERILCRHSPVQVMALVWGKDPSGERPLEWFLPFFERGYVKRVVRLDPEPDFGSAFMEAYGLAASSFPAMSTFDLAHVQVMSSDLGRMRRAVQQSKVRKAPYVRKVWEGLEPTRIVERTVVEFDIGNSGSVKTRSLS